MSNLNNHASIIAIFLAVTNFISLSGEGKLHSLDLWEDSLAASKDSIYSGQDPPSAFPLKRVYASYTAGQGVGYPTGYTTVGAFMTSTRMPTSAYPLVDLRGHYLDNNTWAANAGLGARFLEPNSCAIIGANVFYDFRDNSRAVYHQIGGGIELLWKWIDFRFNIYIPIGQTHHTKTIVFDDPSSPFFIDVELRDYAYTSANALLGAYLYQSNAFSLYAAVGDYYLSSKFRKQTFGFNGLLEAQFTDYFSAAFILSHDPIFGTLCQGRFTLTFPLYRFSSQKRSTTSPCGFTNRQLYQQIRRNEIIPTQLDACYFFNF